MITVRYELVDPAEIDGEAIDITEDRGSLLFKINRTLSPEEIVGALNTGASAILAGGHWFQEWKGDIISVDPHEIRGADDPSTIPAPTP